MALITPNFNPSTALQTPGYPMASVPHSNPIALTEEQQTQNSGVDSPVRDASLAQAGDSSNRVV